MKITKFGHACVRLEHDGSVLVIDPGIFTEPHALIDADAVLVTHEHPDHIDVMRLAGIGIPVLGPTDANIGRLELVSNLDLRRIGVGDVVSLAGFEVRAVGGRHAITYDGQPDCANLGYIVDGRVYHPGDSLHVPEQPIETLFAPVQASWMKIAETVEFIRAINPDRTFPIHDGFLNELGRDGLKQLFARDPERSYGYRWLAPFESA